MRYSHHVSKKYVENSIFFHPFPPLYAISHHHLTHRTEPPHHQPHRSHTPRSATPCVDACAACAIACGTSTTSSRKRSRRNARSRRTSSWPTRLHSRSGACGSSIGRMLRGESQRGKICKSYHLAFSATTTHEPILRVFGLNIRRYCCTMFQRKTRGNTESITPIYFLCRLSFTLPLRAASSPCACANTFCSTRQTNTGSFTRVRGHMSKSRSSIKNVFTLFLEECEMQHLGATFFSYSLLFSASDFGPLQSPHPC
jgi:hypothetical protein